ncbi:hypothetical protein [Virgisporangium aurantiacum]|uniref:Uncharacterized protein n=1 Tax=Virgisporangium aurantiacum TaxID=175570 RepID=A0A8J3ZMP7_9ACTN|nr:hypothetical protein [Virgisporangium aurantiacum]GIJ64371.1 hypothetical protein Vau01_118870 [Virgisporangium aurantiacum]
MSANPNDSTTPVRRVLGSDDLDHIFCAIRAATGTGHLLNTVLAALYVALTGKPGDGDAGMTASGVHPDRYAIPTSQWQAITTAITNRAQAWGTAAEVALELAMNLMPTQYADPAVPAPNFALPDYRPNEYRLTLTRDAVDVISACELHLERLRAFYGPASDIYQTAMHSWHRNLTSLLTMNTGGHTTVSRDGDLSLFIRAANGLVFALIFHGATRRCTGKGCAALIDDDGATRPAGTGAAVRVHKHIPTYPVGAPRPGTWTFHS